MIRIDGFYLYQLGYNIHGIQHIRIFPQEDEQVHTCTQCLPFLFTAVFALDELMNRSIYRMRNISNTATSLRESINDAIDHCRRGGSDVKHPSVDIILRVQERHREFEAVLKAELGNANLYMVSQKAAFDTATLVEAGYLSFPSALSTKVPNALFDISEATKCIAFELPTAAAFHLHRANEIVVGAYWDAVSDGRGRPKSQTLGSYIKALEEEAFEDQYVVSALKDIKNLHRNPTIHADTNLHENEESIDLHGAIRAAIGAMLKAIPDNIDL